MKQYGDICGLNGEELDPVDLIVGGSPCQDFSVAGKRAGLDGDRSGLFLEMIRIIRQMRRKTNGVYPRYALFENVPGLFSSNDGRDFAAVLGEYARIIDPDASDVPCPQEGWPKSGVLLVSNGSIAWRTHDAQFWGVPQRRKRIALVADFRGQTVWEILFEQRGVFGYFTESGAQGEDPSETAEDSLGVTGETVIYDPSVHHGYRELKDRSETVRSRYGTGGNNTPFVVSMQGFGDYAETGVASSCKQRDFKDATDQVCRIDEDTVQSDSMQDKYQYVRRLTPLECERLQGYPSVKYWDIEKMTKDEYIAWNLAEGNIITDAENGKVYGTRGPGGVPYDKPKELEGTILNGYRVYSIRNGETKLQCRAHRIIWISKHGLIPDGYCIDHINNDKLDNRIENLQIVTPEENSHKAKGDGLYKYGLDNPVTKLDPKLKDEIAFVYKYSDLTMRKLAEIYGISKSRIHQIVHEVGWTDIPGASDSARYRAIGNGIALPFWEFLAHRFAEIGGVKTIGSLFDGIGGFPLVFKRAGAETLWTSEIEPFCQKVVEYHHERGEL